MAENFQVPIEIEWAKFLLSNKSKHFDGSVLEHLEIARATLERAVKEVQDTIDQHPLSDRIALELAEREGVRGISFNITVDRFGNLHLNVHRPKRRMIRHWGSNLKSLKELRRECWKLNIDPRPYGRKRRELARILKEARKKSKSEVVVGREVFE